MRRSLLMRWLAVLMTPVAARAADGTANQQVVPPQPQALQATQAPQAPQVPQRPADIETRVGKLEAILQNQAVLNLLKEVEVRITNVFLARIVSHAVDGAADRLEHPSCQGIFGEFTDHEGRVLADNLAALGDDAPSFLARLLIYEARNHKLCRTGRVLAITSPGSRVVLVCGDLFQQTYMRDRPLAEAILIHEALHSLGLGDNPPSSQEITMRVLHRCRRKVT